MSGVTVLDGGFSTQLSSHVGDRIDGDPLWTSRFLVTHPEAVRATHLDFLRAGCEIIETNTYQASITGFVKYLDITPEESLGLVRKGVELAKDAVALYQRECELNENPVVNPEPLIAGSCGPYGAALHNGSEYTGSYGKDVSKESLIEWHRSRIQTLLNSGVDLLALETIPCSVEADALMDLLREFPGAKCWISFSCNGPNRTLVDGSSFVDTALGCYRKRPGQIVAVGVNCLAPQYVAPLLENINKKRNEFVPLIAYPNSGEKYTVEKGWHGMGEGEWIPIENFVNKWIGLGTKYIGGCCRTTAMDIVNIRKRIES